MYSKKAKFNLARCLICLLLVLVLTIFPLLLSGCKTDGEDGKQGPQGQQGIQGPVGPQGPQGPQGLPGEDGANNSWHFGSGNPNTSQPDGSVGDLYLDITNYDIYELRDNPDSDGTKWVVVGNIKGIAGNKGETGDDGETGPDGQKGPVGAQGEAGIKGKDGTTWFVGASTPTDDKGVDGDLYLDSSSWNIYKKQGSTWGEPIGNIKGEVGSAGQQGEQGDKGPQGDPGQGLFVGYDHYIWNGKERTSYYLPNKNDADTFEQTTGITEEMSKYFSPQYVDLLVNKIALMSHYKENANVTLFSDMEINEITVYAEKEGRLEVGTAKVKEIVEARTSNGSLEVGNTTSHQLTQGRNVITFETPLVVGADETIVLGGNGSVPLYYAQNIPVDDEAGNFTVLDNKTHPDVIETSGNDYADTLAIEVKVNLTKELPIFDDLKGHLKKDIGNLSTIKKNIGVEQFGPFIYGNENLFAGKTITKISIPVKALVDQGDGCYLDLYKIPAYNSPSDEDAKTARKDPKLLEKPYKLDPPAIKLTSEQVIEANKKLESEYNDGGCGWVDFRCNITFGDGKNNTTKETLAFCGSEHGVEWIWSTDDPIKLSSIDQYYTQFNFTGVVGKDYGGNVDSSQYMFFDCYYAVEWSLEKQIEKIDSLEYNSVSAERNEIIKNTLASKNSDLIYSTNLVYNEKIGKLAKDMDNVVLEDIFKDCGWTRDTVTTYANDGLYPNQLGMETISKSFTKALYKNLCLDNKIKRINILNAKYQLNLKCKN